MAQITKGVTYNTNDTVTASNLNSHVDNAVLLPGAITDQTAKTVPLGADSVLLHSSADSALRKTALSDMAVARLITARTISLTGDVTGSIGFDGSANVALATTLAASTVPAGSVFAFAAASAPTGYLACNGSAVSRSTYAGLFAITSTAFGVGDGSTTFNLPDLRGEFIRGFDGGRGVDTGRVFGSAQADELESHTHTVTHNNTHITSNGEGYVAGANSFNGTFTVTSSATGGSETRPRNIAMLYCIKT